MYLKVCDGNAGISDLHSSHHYFKMRKILKTEFFFYTDVPYSWLLFCTVEFLRSHRFVPLYKSAL